MEQGQPIPAISDTKTEAGILNAEKNMLVTKGAPRACGDEPAYAITGAGWDECSPRLRG